MKKILFLAVIFALALGAGCKRKVEQAPPPPPPTPVEKQSQQEMMKSFVQIVSNLKLGEVIHFKVDREKFISDYSAFDVSLFPTEFFTSSEEKYLLKYMFPSVVWRWDEFQLQVLNLEEYYIHREDGGKVWILKESPKGTPPFKNIPTVLAEARDGNFWVLDQNGNEMPLRANFGK